MTLGIIHKYTSDGGKALEHQYWGLGAPGTRIMYESCADMHIHAFLRFDTDLLGLSGTLPKVASCCPPHNGADWTARPATVRAQQPCCFAPPVL